MLTWISNQSREGIHAPRTCKCSHSPGSECIDEMRASNLGKFHTAGERWCSLHGMVGTVMYYPKLLHLTHDDARLYKIAGLQFERKCETYEKHSYSGITSPDPSKRSFWVLDSDCSLEFGSNSFSKPLGELMKLRSKGCTTRNLKVSFAGAIDMNKNDHNSKQTSRDVNVKCTSTLCPFSHQLQQV